MSTSSLIFPPPLTNAPNVINDGDKGEVTVSGSGTIWTIDNGAITNAKHENFPANSIQGNNTGSPATPAYLTATQATAMLNAFTDTAKGLAPASAGGTTNFLRADGAWTAPPAGAGIVYPSYGSGRDIDASVNGGSPTNVASLANTIRAYIWELRSSVTLTSARITVQTTSAGGLIRIGIYNVGAGWYPTTLVANSDAGTQGTDTAGTKTFTFASPITLPSGIYAIATNVNNATATYRTIPVTAMYPIPAIDPVMPTTRNTIWPAAFTFAAMPTTFPSGSASSSTGGLQVVFRVQ